MRPDMPCPAALGNGRKDQPARLFRLTAREPVTISASTDRPRGDTGLFRRGQYPRGGMSRAAKGADCKSAGLAFAGSSPASPTTFP